MTSTSAGADGDENGGKKSFAPAVSRRVRACDACRSHKIKCDLQTIAQSSSSTGTAACSRCKRLGLTCNVTKSLQSLLQERGADQDWRASVEQRLKIVFQTLGLPQTSQHSDSNDHELQQQSKRRRITSSDHALGILAAAASKDSDGSTSTTSMTWNDATGDPASAPGLHLTQISGPSRQSSAASANAPKRNSSLNERHHSDTPPIARNTRAGIIERGLITENQALDLTQVYLTYLDQHVYSMVSLAHAALTSSLHTRAPTSSNQHAQSILNSIRRSPLLLLSVCTVAALHCADGSLSDDQNDHIVNNGCSSLFSLLHDEYVRASAQQSVARDQSLDDIRALVIASWWLRDLSWISSGTAVRIATERGMQEAYKRSSDMHAGKQACRAKALRETNGGGGSVACAPGEAIVAEQADGSLTTEEAREAYEAARLYYIVYVADHQAAIPFSRPPMTRQHAAVRNVRAWLAGCASAHKHEDVRLAAHVEQWVIAHDVVDDFGVDVQQALSQRQVTEQVPRFLALLDRWQARWQSFALLRQEIAFHADMMRLFVAAHTFRSPRGVDPLSITVDDDRDAEWALDDVEFRESFAEKALPHFASWTMSATSRFDLGCQAVEMANALIKQATFANEPMPSFHRRAETKPGKMFGLPIYPFAMLLFACLFLNKLSRRRQQEGATLPGCSLSSTVKRIEQVAEYLDKCIVNFCASEHISATVLPGLQALLQAEQERLDHEQSVSYDRQESAPSHDYDIGGGYNQERHGEELSIEQRQDHQQAAGREMFEGEDNTALPSPAFDFDLKSLDQLSGERYLSGITNDAAFWGFDMSAALGNQSSDVIADLM